DLLLLPALVARTLLQRGGGEALLAEHVAQRHPGGAGEPVRVQDLHGIGEVGLLDLDLPALLAGRRCLLGRHARCQQRRHDLVGLLLLQVGVERGAAAGRQQQAGEYGGNRAPGAWEWTAHAGASVTTAGGTAAGSRPRNGSPRSR